MESSPVQSSPVRVFEQPVPSRQVQSRRRVQGTVHALDDEGKCRYDHDDHSIMLAEVPVAGPGSLHTTTCWSMVLVATVI
jgi:hypothetical protein